MASLKEEMVRIARKEIRAETEALRKACTRHRSEIAELKRQLAQVKKTPRKAATVRPVVEELAAAQATARFRRDGIRSHIARLGITFNGMSALLDVSAVTLRKLELGELKPTSAQMARFAELRAYGRREAARQLATLSPRRRAWAAKPDLPTRTIDAAS